MSAVGTLSMLKQCTLRQKQIISSKVRMLRYMYQKQTWFMKYSINDNKGARGPLNKHNLQ